MSKDKNIKVNNLSYGAILKVFNELSFEQKLYLIQKQDTFYQERIINLLPKSLGDLITEEINKLIILSGDEREDLINKIASLPTVFIQSESSDSNEKLSNLKSLARSISDDDSDNNLNNLNLVLYEICVLSKREGFVYLDFLLLREDGIQEDVFCWLLTELTMGADLSKVIKESSLFSMPSFGKSKYIGMLTKGLIYIQTAKDCTEFLK
ncbi:hypothetical protein LPTSP3_g26480 [Leptospira kobayashii]|uniref:Uncharacterized protein n=1 Tax=Leptospira kobayashii TaxID=1917830 RepID=A0ABM7UT27_9LEPT|nr:hypothetical protein [Leptospira kobayashii]BDA79718.1 hypothetical protein LPTSP3_g26480 [Leptospira kobayashii]